MNYNQLDFYTGKQHKHVAFYKLLVAYQFNKLKESEFKCYLEREVLMRTSNGTTEKKTKENYTGGKDLKKRKR